MRVVIGFIALHALFAACGITLLRAFGLYPPAATRRDLITTSGPALLLGVALIVQVLIVLLVAGVALTPLTVAVVGVGSAAIAETVARRRNNRAPQVEPTRSSSASRFTRAGVAVVGAYAAFGAFALARLPTVGDDARIWSLRGVTLAYYHALQPEIFQSPFQAGAHPVYPLFQPVLEAVLSQAVGHVQLGLYHAELWLLFIAMAWTAGYALSRRTVEGSGLPPVWLGALALLATTPAAIHNIVLADADIIGSVMLATAALALGLWIESDSGRWLALATVLLAASANIKNEDLLASGAVLLIGGIVAMVANGSTVRRSTPMRRFWLWGASAGCYLAAVAPWRVWTSVHHLFDSVEPPLPRALSPVYVLDRLHQLHLTASDMLTQTLDQWGWLAAIFLATCLVGMLTRTARRITCFYSVAFLVVTAILLWLYTTTTLSLRHLLPSSMDRTVDVFMALAAFATAHLISVLVTPGRPQHVSLAPPDRAPAP